MCVLTRGVGPRIHWCIAMVLAALLPFTKVSLLNLPIKVLTAAQSSRVGCWFVSRDDVNNVVLQRAMALSLCLRDHGFAGNVSRKNAARVWYVQLFPFMSVSLLFRHFPL